MYRRSAPYKFNKAYEMRHNPTEAEARMWEILRNEVMPNFPGYIFYRQSVQFGYILDFFCPSLGLGIEVDGDVHDARGEYDEERDSNLANLGIDVWRFRNEDVINNSQVVSTDLCRIIQDKTTPWYVKLLRCFRRHR